MVKNLKYNGIIPLFTMLPPPLPTSLHSKCVKMSHGGRRENNESQLKSVKIIAGRCCFGTILSTQNPLLPAFSGVASRSGPRVPLKLENKGTSQESKL